ncbi:MAG: hypothetical protein AAGF71_04600 [Pseudomonadota bacterium]
MKHKVLAAAVLMVGAAPGVASSLATGAEITSAISSNTVQGGMADGTAYTEFYADDGTIKGAGYTGTWMVEDDQMCFDYGEGANCWSVRIAGETVTWVKDGTDDGSGTVVEGNPNAF